MCACLCVLYHILEYYSFQNTTANTLVMALFMILTNYIIDVMINCRDDLISIGDKVSIYLIVLVFTVYIFQA